MKSKLGCSKLSLKVFFSLVGTLILFVDGEKEGLRAQTSGDKPTSVLCAEFMVPKQPVNGSLIGQEDCYMQEVVVTYQDEKYRRVDMGISGTIEGWVVKEGARIYHFTSAPDFLFTQAGNHHKRFHGILRYEASKGTSMTVLYPEAGTAWNGRLYVTVHGASGSFLQGTLKRWDQIFDPSDPLGDFSDYEKLMLEKGYAVAKTRRNSDMRNAGDYSVTLDDGEIVEGKNISDHPELILGFTRLAESFLKSRLSQKPSRTYWYGHSGGVMTGRLIQYMPETNIDEDGKPIIDGFLFDDPGGGLWLPVLFRDGKDVLFSTEKERLPFVKSIDIVHQLYSNTYVNPLLMNVEDIPKWVSPVYLVNKRTNAKLLRDKGLQNKYRMYEVRGVSHSGGEYLEDGKRGDIQILKLSRVIDAVIDLLEDWVEQNVEPPATKSDLLELGDVNGDGFNENEALALPDVACPLGLYYPYPSSSGSGGVGSTSFAVFDGKSLEPFDGRGVFVDMNLNRTRDYRETVTQAWRRLGLLKPGATFNRDRYMSCIKATVSKLRKENFITERIATLYAEEAAEVKLPE